MALETRSDVENRLRSELNQWFQNQVRDPYQRYYLYYLPTTAQHEGGFLFCADPPPNPDYQLASPACVDRGGNVDQNFIAWRDIVTRLPILAT